MFRSIHSPRVDEWLVVMAFKTALLAPSVLGSNLLITTRIVSNPFPPGQLLNNLNG